MSQINEVPNDATPTPAQDIAYFEAKIAASGKPRTDPANQRYVKIIEELKKSRQVLLG